MEVDDDNRIPGIVGTSIHHHLAGAEDWQRLMNMRRYMDHVSHEDEDDDEDGPRSVEYDEEGVRRPDPVRMQRLISRQYSAERSVFGRADDPSVDWLFPPPRHLSLQEPFEMVMPQVFFLSKPIFNSFIVGKIKRKRRKEVGSRQYSIT
jgi:hypothetical protein